MPRSFKKKSWTRSRSSAGRSAPRRVARAPARVPRKRRPVRGSRRSARVSRGEESTVVNIRKVSKPKSWVRTYKKMTASQYTKFLSSERFSSGDGYQAIQNFMIGKTTELETVTANAQTVSAAYKATNASVLLEKMTAFLRLTNHSTVPATLTIYQILSRSMCELGPLALWDKYASAQGSSAYKVDATPFEAKGFGHYYKIQKTTTHTIQGGSTVTVNMDISTNYMMASNQLVDSDNQFNVPHLTRGILVVAKGGLVQDSINKSQVTTAAVSVVFDLNIVYKWSINQVNSSATFENGTYGVITNSAKFVNEDSGDVHTEEVA